jgi:hypothetical protein
LPRTPRHSGASSHTPLNSHSSTAIGTPISDELTKTNDRSQNLPTLLAFDNTNEEASSRPVKRTKVVQKAKATPLKKARKKQSVTISSSFVDRNKKVTANKNNLPQAKANINPNILSDIVSSPYGKVSGDAIPPIHSSVGLPPLLVGIQDMASQVPKGIVASTSDEPSQDKQRKRKRATARSAQNCGDISSGQSALKVIQRSNTFQYVSSRGKPTTRSQSAVKVSKQKDIISDESPSEPAKQSSIKHKPTIKSKDPAYALWRQKSDFKDHPEVKSMSKAADKPAEQSSEKPEPHGQPEVWADGHQALCETLPYYRSFQGGGCTSKGFAHAFMLDANGHERDYIDENVVISRTGGGMSRDGQSGKMFVNKDQTDSHNQIQSLKRNIAHHNPVVIILGGKNEQVQSKMPYTYNVLDWFKPTYIWAEKFRNKILFRYRFEKLNPNRQSW